MPYLIGKSESDARSALDAAGLRLGRVSEEYSSSAPGTVIKQQYSSNTQLKKGSSVSITISKGPQPTTAPPVTEPTQETEEDD